LPLCTYRWHCGDGTVRIHAGNYVLCAHCGSRALCHSWLSLHQSNHHGSVHNSLNQKLYTQLFMHKVFHIPTVQASTYCLVHSSLNQSLCSCSKSSRHPLCRLVITVQYTAVSLKLIVIHPVLQTPSVHANHHASVHKSLNQKRYTQLLMHKVFHTPSVQASNY
jgi:hypothetical protein